MLQNSTRSGCTIVFPFSYAWSIFSVCPSRPTSLSSPLTSASPSYPLRLTFVDTLDLCTGPGLDIPRSAPWLCLFSDWCFPSDDWLRSEDCEARSFLPLQAMSSFVCVVHSPSDGSYVPPHRALVPPLYPFPCSFLIAAEWETTRLHGIHGWHNPADQSSWGFMGLLIATF